MSGFGALPYGLTPYGGPVPIPGTGGGMTVDWQLWRATIDNRLVEDISDQLDGGGWSLNMDRARKGEATFHLKDAARVDPYVDYLALFQTVEYDDDRQPPVTEQLGLYSIRVPAGTRTVQRGEGQYPASDLTSVLARQAFESPLNVNPGVNYVGAVTIIGFLGGITQDRFLIPYDPRATATAITFPTGTTYLDACNTLLEAIGYYHLSCTRDGRLTSGPSRAISQVQPYRTVTDADLMGEVTTQPTDTSVANIVIVIQDNFNAPPLTAVRRNDAADSPTSTVNIGPIVRRETRSDLADQAAVDALADRLLSEGRTFYQTARLPLLPDARVLTPHQTIELDLTGKLAILNGRWHIRTASGGFTSDTAGPVLEINRVTDKIRGALI